MTYGLRDKNPNYFIPWECIAHEMRAALVCRACEIALEGDNEAARKFIGFEIENWEEPNLEPEALAQVDLQRFPEVAGMELIHSFAYQIGHKRRRAMFDEADLEEPPLIEKAFDSAYNVTGRFYIAHYTVGAIAGARYQLQDSWSLGVEGLSTLSGLKEEVVKASLKAEGLRNKGDVYLEPDLAEAWLRRRGFKPTLLPDDIGVSAAAMTMELLRTDSFHRAVTRGIYLIRDSVQTVAANAHVDLEWLYAVVENEPVPHDVKALKRVAVHLGVDADLFASRAIEELPKSIYRTIPVWRRAQEKQRRLLESCAG